MPARKEIELTKKERDQLISMQRAGTTEQRMVQRISIILAAAEGHNNEEVANQCGCNIHTARLWRNRWLEEGFEGLKDAQGRGKKPIYTAEMEAKIIAETLNPPEDCTHWSARRLAKHLGISKDAVHRVWKRHKLQPHRQETFKYSKDPELVEKVIDIAGLYLDPPKKAIVLCVDEKSQIQALDRTQPLLPIKMGHPECRTHDYKRNGTTTLFAALNIATGEVVGKCKERHRHQEFLNFLNTIDKHFPKGDIHLILDNYCTHKHEKVKKWFARRPRYHVHFTPTSASWLNQVETWFSVLSRQAVRRGTFTSVKVLIQAIYRFIDNWNDNASPFKWVKDVDQILYKAIK